MSNAIEAILSWSQSLSDWQRDALRRLFIQGKISSDDIDSLVKLAKEVGEVCDSNNFSHPLSQEHIPVSSDEAHSIHLAKIKDLENVNALTLGQTLEFSKTGLTVIYGENGTGKSGYARVLKHACRAREQEDVLPNVRAAHTLTPKGTIEIEDGGVPINIAWNKNETPNPILSSISVFDSKCARVYLNKGNEIVYLPYGVDIIHKLADVSDRVKEKLKEERNRLRLEQVRFPDLEGSHTVGQAISKLPTTTSFDEIERLCNLSANDRGRLEELRELLHKGNPLVILSRLKLLSGGVKKGLRKVSELKKSLSEKVICAAKRVDANIRQSDKDAITLTKKFFSDSDIFDGTGSSEAWLEMYSAARAFSEAHAYPGEKFPYLGDEARCPLCQQILVDGAMRFKKFAEFAEKKAKKMAQDLKARHAKARTYYKARLSDFPLLESNIIEEIRKTDKALTQEIEDDEKTCRDCLLNISKALDSGNWESVNVVSESIFKSLSYIDSTLDSQIEKYTKIDGSGWKKIEQEYKGLAARSQLQLRKADVLAFIDARNTRNKLDKIIRSINTNAISSKAKEIAETRVTKNLKKALSREFHKLDLGKLGVVFKASAGKGQVTVKYLIESDRPFRLEPVLSEGEQRALALASFFAEVSVSKRQQGIILDDPVSSLDSNRRKLVAERIVHEASARQVIVFTHDLYFLSQLQDAAQQNEIQLHARMVVAREDRIGLIQDEIPFFAKRIETRIDALCTSAKKASSLLENNEIDAGEALMRNCYRQLRETWERFIEVVFLNSVVVRLRPSIETRRLGKVQITDEDRATIEEGMSKCSAYLHDSPSDAPPLPLSPSMLVDDIQHLKEFNKKIKKRQDVKQRK